MTVDFGLHVIGAPILDTDEFSINQRNGIVVYPNPTKDGNINVKINNFSNYSVSVIDVNGRVLETKRINAQITNLPVGDLNPGIYFLQFVSETTTYTKKLIIQN